MGSCRCEPSDYPSPPTTPWRKTPLIESSRLSRQAGCRILLKLENLQPSGSFKSRGIGNLILSVINSRQSSPTGTPSNLHFYSSSGGNAGLAAVTAAHTIGYPCSVIVPWSTEEAMVAKLKEAGATEVIVHGDSWFYADKHLREAIIPRAKTRGEEGVYVPPFDDERIWDGAATMVEEIKEQIIGMVGDATNMGTPPKGIVCSVGGGGLFCGIIRGLDRVGWGEGKVRVAAVETKGAESLAVSLEKRELTTLPAITSVAKSLGATQVAREAFIYASNSKLCASVVLSDAAACTACVRFADDERILVEPACGASLALAYDAKKLRSAFPGLKPDDTVVVVVCGGSGVSLEKLEDWKREYGPRVDQEV
ncbi:hypothetical protein DV736_g1183, partial [Chaetothyriales sp. CBS 134916]